MPNQRLLVNSIVLQEARISSEIENIVTTNDALYRAVASPDEAVDPQTKEVLRYREALWHGFERIQNRPIGTNLCVELVSEIRGVQMEVRRVPGTTLKNQEGGVVYTPPMGEDLIRKKLGNLADYIHSDDGPDPLIRMAVMHYQFEAIHPFTDGNGRTGRILNILYLLEAGLLDWPVLYLSGYIFKHRSAYYAGLRAVTEKQEWESWVLFMLKAVEETARQTLTRVNKILESMNETAEKVKAELPKIYSKDLIEVIYNNPYCRIQFIEEAGLGSRLTASQYLNRLADIGILKAVKVGRSRYYINDRLLGILATTGDE